jgi:hypothetical protein
MLAENSNGVFRRFQWRTAQYKYDKYLIRDGYWPYIQTVTGLAYGQLLALHTDSYWPYIQTVTGLTYRQLMALHTDS